MKEATKKERKEERIRKTNVGRKESMKKGTKQS
jgi:hypothetical protein